MDTETDVAIADLAASVQILSTAVFALIKATPNRDVLRTVHAQIEGELTSHLRPLVESGSLPGAKAILQGLDTALGR